jgi:hypothetical protein
MGINGNDEMFPIEYVLCSLELALSSDLVGVGPFTS